MIKNFILLAFCAFTSVLSAQPVINSFSPIAAPMGTQVIIKGTGFDPVAANNIVYFGGVRGTVSSASTTSITATAPIGASYYYVTVYNTTTALTAYATRSYDLTTSCGTAINTSSLGSPVSFNVAGGGERTIAIVDIDGDGKNDMLVGNRSGAYVTAFRNISTAGTLTNGSFAAGQNFTVADGPIAIAYGDIDGDGKKDIITCTYNNSFVSVLRNTSTSGVISFASEVTQSCGSGPYGVAVGDVDGDGKPDVLTGNYNAGTLSVLKNNSTSGTISLGTSVNFTASSQSHGVIATDIDGDGKIEAIVANRGGTNVSVFRNTSTTGVINSSSFAAKVDFTTSGAEDLVAGDFDGDGKMDVAVYGSAVSVLRNTSTTGVINSSSFAAPVNLTTTGGYGLGIGDVNGDGKPDLAAMSSGNNLALFENMSASGSIAFGTAQNFTAASTGFHTGIGDLDMDGKADVISAPLSGSTMSVWRNTIASGTLTITNTFTNNTCGSNGSASVTATGGSGTLTYSWSNGQTASTATGLAAGTFSCTVTDNTGCKVRAVFWITGPAALSAAIAGVDAKCNGASDGSASVTTSGGVTAYTYSWSAGGGTTASIINLSAGTYTCTITDACGATVTRTVSISEPAGMNLSIASQINPACFGANTGSASATATGGTGTLTYSWSNGATGATASGLTAGTYICTVTDNGGCSKTTTLVITQPAQLLTNPTNDTLLCVGKSLVINANASGGTSSYTYSWNPGGATTSSITVSPTVNTTYTMTITDGNGCTRVDSVVVTVDPCLGMAENAANSLQIYPNPSGGVFNLMMRGFDDLMIDIYNVLGETVLHHQTTKSSQPGGGQANYQINLSDQPAGVYLLKVVFRDGSAVTKMIEVR